MSERISGISNVYNYTNTSGGSSNFYQKNENADESFQEVLEEQIELPNGLPRVRKGLTDYGSLKALNIKKDEYPYPIKYVCVPVYLISNDDKALGYMAAKCFVTSYKENYLENGEIVKEYEVVYPYNTLMLTYEDMKKPEFENKKCINSEKTDKVFENYKSAKDECFLKNLNLGVDQNTLSLIDTYEELVFQRTKDFEITIDKKQTFNYPKNTK